MGLRSVGLALLRRVLGTRGRSDIMFLGICTGTCRIHAGSGCQEGGIADIGSPDLVSTVSTDDREH